jgi:hypothetical protein
LPEAVLSDTRSSREGNEVKAAEAVGYLLGPVVATGDLEKTTLYCFLSTLIAERLLEAMDMASLSLGLRNSASCTAPRFARNVVSFRPP